MPVTLPPISRRQFIAGSVATGIGWFATANAYAAESKIDPHRFALMADTHISGKRDKVVREANMYTNFQRASQEILELEQLPSATFINGDCALLTGEDKDYSTLVELLQPIRKAGMAVHLAMGNHDHRDRLWNAVPPAEGQNKVLVNRHITIVNSARANWFVLDSLDKTNHTPGRLGKEQLQWLAKTLDQHTDKPALIVSHHNPDHREKPLGLTDTTELLKVLTPRKQVKAFFFGHTHDWKLKQHEGLHLVNLPPVAYVFKKENPNGWVDAHLKENSVLLELRCHEAKHPQQGQKFLLKWRA